MTKNWKSRKEVITEYYLTLKCLKELKTSFVFLDENVKAPSIIAISARPSVGKSLLVEQIGHDFINNGFRWLSFQLELSSFEIIKRELIYTNAANNRELYFEKTLNKPIDVIENVSIYNLGEIINNYITTYRDDKILVTIDHLFLVGGSDNGKNLQPIFSEVVKLKKKGVYFILLSHLKRDIYLPDRCKQGHVNNLIFENDVYMSDTILQYCDLNLALDIPSRRGITIYGPNKINVNTNDMIILTLKNRNGKRNLYHYSRNDNLTYTFVDVYDESGLFAKQPTIEDFEELSNINKDLF